MPPRFVYPESVRKKYGPNLITLPVHADCNRQYQLDEEYFHVSVGVIATERTRVGPALWMDIRTKIRKPRSGKLLMKVISEFEKRPGGLHLPAGQIAKRYDDTRIWRVLWKIVRGLYFYETGTILPEDAWHETFDFSAEPTRDETLEYVLSTPSRGRHGAIFDYKYLQLEDHPGTYVWAMLFWERLIAHLVFQHPSCPCSTCTDIRLSSA